MNIKNEVPSLLWGNQTRIILELDRLNHLLVHHSDSGNRAKAAQIIDNIKRLEMQLSAIELELDRRFSQNESNNDPIRPSS